MNIWLVACAYEHLLEADKISNVKVKLFSGISLLSCFDLEKEQRLPDGRIETIPRKLRIKPKVTRYFARKMNNELSLETTEECN